MTVAEFVNSHPVMGINGWIAAIENAGLVHMQSLIIECAIHFNRITVNSRATFGAQSINI